VRVDSRLLLLSSCAVRSFFSLLGSMLARELAHATLPEPRHRSTPHCLACDVSCVLRRVQSMAFVRVRMCDCFGCLVPVWCPHEVTLIAAFFLHCFKLQSLH
jgi:hypothetical protein